MPLLQCGFLANQPLEPGAEPNNSHELASAVPVPVSTATNVWKPCSGGWGFALAVGASDHRAVSWGVNSATLLAKSVSVEPLCVSAKHALQSSLGKQGCWWRGSASPQEGKLLAVAPALSGRVRMRMGSTQPPWRKWPRGWTLRQQASTTACLLLAGR
jgi:hypothetical protein